MSLWQSYSIQSRSNYIYRHCKKRKTSHDLKTAAGWVRALCVRETLGAGAALCVCGGGGRGGCHEVVLGELCVCVTLTRDAY